MKQRIILSIIMLIMFFSILSVGCSSNKARNLRWQLIAKRTGEVQSYYNQLIEEGTRPATADEYAYQGQSPRLLILSDNTDIEALQKQVRPADLEKIVDVNFDKYWIAVISLGYQHDTKHTVNIQGVDMDRFEDDIIIHTSAIQHEIIDEHDSSPYYVLRIRKPRGTEHTTFALDMDGTRIPQSCAMSGTPVSWEKIFNYYHSNYDSSVPQIKVLDDRTPLDTIDSLDPVIMSRIAGINFSTHLAIIINQGSKSTTGYNIEVLSVRYAERDNLSVIKVCAQYHEPKEGAMVGQAETSPFYVIQIERIPEMRDRLMIELNVDEDITITELLDL